VLSFSVFLCPRSHSAATGVAPPPFSPSPDASQTPRTPFDNTRVADPLVESATYIIVGPQEGGLQISPTADLMRLPDSPAEDMVIIKQQTLIPQHFCFFTHQGESTGRPAVGPSCDTTFLRRNPWVWEECLAWKVVTAPPFDSMAVPCGGAAVDSGGLVVIDGSPAVTPPPASDIDGSGSLPMNIADLVYLVDWMFAGGPPPICPQSADCNGDSAADVADMACWVDWTFPRR